MSTTFEPELDQPLPRRVRAREGCGYGCGIWFFRLFMLPHTIIGPWLVFKAISNIVLYLGVLLAGQDMDGKIIRKFETQGKKGPYYFAEYVFTFDQLQYELMHNLVIETTRMSIEVKNLKMRIESLASRLEFNERRARALESVVVYKPSGDDRPVASASPAPFVPREAPARPAYVPPPRSAAPSSVEAGSPPPSQNQMANSSGQGQPGEGPGQRSRRRRRRRGRRGGRPAVAIMGQPGGPQTAESSGEAEDAAAERADAVESNPPQNGTPAGDRSEPTPPASSDPPTSQDQ